MAGYNWGNAAAGAGAGAGAGFAALGPGGAIPGALVGGLVGGGDPTQAGGPIAKIGQFGNWLGQQAGIIPQQGGPFGTNAYRSPQTAAQGAFNPAANYDSSGSNAWQGRQQSLADQLAAMAAGRTPSLAALQAQQAGNQGMQQTLGLMAAQRGLSPGQAAAQAANTNAGLAQQTGMTAAQARLAEQQAALGQLGQVTGQARGQSMQDALAAQQGAQFNAGQQNQIGLQNANMQNQFGLQQNQQIAQQAAQQQQANLQLRNQFAQQLAQMAAGAAGNVGNLASGGMLSSLGGGGAGMLAAL